MFVVGCKFGRDIISLQKWRQNFRIKNIDRGTANFY